MAVGQTSGLRFQQLRLKLEPCAATHPHEESLWPELADGRIQNPFPPSLPSNRVVHLGQIVGLVDLDLGATVATFCPRRLVMQPKSQSMKPNYLSRWSTLCVGHMALPLACVRGRKME